MSETGPPEATYGAADGAAAESKADTGRRLVWWISGGFSLLAAVVAGTIALPLLPPLAIPPFTTGGRIHVESPEVYTRERLVNDRYRQDFWLKSQLNLLDQSDNLIQAIEAARLGVGTTTTETGQDAFKIEDLAVAFREQFLLRAAVRDKIRQLILENLLDDRHDLTGNSLYGLKFDTGVVPGTNTHLRPYVKVRVLLNDIERGGVDDLLTSEGFLVGPVGGTQAEAYETAVRQFSSWERNLESRLNSFVAERWTSRNLMPSNCARSSGAEDLNAGLENKLGEVLASDGRSGDSLVATAAPVPLIEPAAAPATGGRAREERVIREALSNVLGIAERGVLLEWPDSAKGEDLKENHLPDPWGRYFRLLIGEYHDGLESDTSAPFFLDLQQFTVELNVVDLEDWQTFLSSENGDDRFRVWPARFFRQEGRPVNENSSDNATASGLAKDRVLLVPTVRETMSGSDNQQLSKFTPSSDEFAFANTLGPEDFYHLQNWTSEEQCVVRASVEKGGGCLLEGSKFVIKAPLYDFVRSRKRSDSYSYAVFPRGDVEGVLTDRTQTAETSIPLSGDAPALSATVRRLEARAEPIVVNFASHQSVADEIEFGWVIAKPGKQSPRQLSQLVLVSVPAYLEEIELEIETGWLDRNSREMQSSDEPSKVMVSLPPDFEALDTVVVGGTLSEGPVIDQYHFNDSCREEVIVRACQTADILIPGARLWRSTTVTLGGQVADRITVTPDMRGIIASFDSVSWPPELDGMSAEHAYAPLTVWTSEGSDRLDREITILAPRSDAIGMDCRTLMQMPATGSAD